MERRTLALQAAAAGMTLVAFVGVMNRTSSAVLTATTTNAGNIWEIANLTISHNPATTMFTLDAAGAGPVSIPSSGGPKCVDVTVSTAGDAADVKLYVGNVVNTDGAANTGTDATLSDDLELQITVYPAGETCSLKTTGTVVKTFTTIDAFGTSYAAAGAATLWNPGAGTDLARAVEVSWRLQDTTQAEKDLMKGDKVQLDIIWETQE